MQQGAELEGNLSQEKTMLYQWFDKTKHLSHLTFNVTYSKVQGAGAWVARQARTKAPHSLQVIKQFAF